MPILFRKHCDKSKDKCAMKMWLNRSLAPGPWGVAAGLEESDVGTDVCQGARQRWVLGARRPLPDAHCSFSQAPRSPPRPRCAPRLECVARRWPPSAGPLVSQEPTVSAEPPWAGRPCTRLRPWAGWTASTCCSDTGPPSAPRTPRG